MKEAARRSGIVLLSSLVILVAAATARAQGIASRYPDDRGIQADPQVLYFSDLESDSWFADWGLGAKPRDGNIVSSDPSESFSPFLGKALRVTLPSGNNSGISAFRSVNQAEEIYFRYYLRFGSSWQTLDGGKLPGLAGDLASCGNGGRPCDGTDGWSGRGAFGMVTGSGTVPIGSYIYDGEMLDRGDAYGTQYWWGNLEKSRWYCVEHFIKLNTVGQQDGVYRGWIDGQLAFEKTDFVFRKVNALKVEAVWMNVYHGGTTPVDRTIHLYMDNVVIARSYVGPVGASAGPPPPPVLPGTPPAQPADGSRSKSSDACGCASMSFGAESFAGVAAVCSALFLLLVLGRRVPGGR